MHTATAQRTDMVDDAETAHMSLANESRQKRHPSSRGDGPLPLLPLPGCPVPGATRSDRDGEKRARCAAR